MRPERQGTLLAASGALLAATFFIPYKAATGIADVDHVVIAMLAPAALFNTVTALWLQRGRMRVTRPDLAVAVLLALLAVAGNIAMTEALALVDAGVAAVLLQTQVFFVAVGGWVLLGERVTLRFTIGAIIAIGGFVLMRDPFSNESPVSVAGALWAMGAALSFGMMHVVTRRYITSIRPVTVNALRLWMAVAILLALPGRAGGVIELSSEAWLLAATAALLGPFAARLCIMFAVRYVQASYAALFGLITPMFAFILQTIILGVTPSVLEVAGALIILAGIALPVLEVAGRERPPTR